MRIRLPRYPPCCPAGGRGMSHAVPLQTSKRVLEPIERISEVLFGLIMVLTFTGSLSAAESGRAEVRTMLLGALGCNIAWGVIDGIMYLMDCLATRGKDLRTVSVIKAARGEEEARQAILQALPPIIASALDRSDLKEIYARVMQIPLLSVRARLEFVD